jgi:hypothetical protein
MIAKFAKNWSLFANPVQPGQQVAEDQEVELELFSDPQKARPVATGRQLTERQCRVQLAWEQLRGLVKLTLHGSFAAVNGDVNWILSGNDANLQL